MADQDISVILVDEQDDCIGYCDKLEAHRKGLLHRAVSVMLFDEDGNLLIQRRALGKYHAAGLWANTCCGHPLPGESPQEAAERRLFEELGLSSPLTFLCHIYYKKDLPNGMIEHEYVWVFKGLYTQEPIRPDPSEVMATRLISLPQLYQEVDQQDDQYAGWFVHYVQNHSPELFA